MAQSSSYPESNVRCAAPVDVIDATKEVTFAGKTKENATAEH